MYCNHYTLYPLPHLAHRKPYRHIGGVFATTVLFPVFYIGGGIEIGNKVRKVIRLCQVPGNTAESTIQAVVTLATPVGRSATGSHTIYPMVTNRSPDTTGVSPWRQLPNGRPWATIGTPNTTQPGTRRPRQ